MKRCLTAALTLLTALSLTAAARADVIAAPAGVVVLSQAMELLPLLLVALVVAVTAALLWKFRKKKK